MDRAGLVVLLVAGVAAAHVEETPKRERLELRPSSLRLIIDYAIPAGEDARGLRKIFDRDHSGRLDAVEYAALAKALGDEARRFLSLTVDGKPVALRLAGSSPGPVGQANERLVVELTLEAEVAVRGKVVLDDRHKDRRVLVPVTVVTDGLNVQTPSLTAVSQGHPLELAIQ